jgi:hypothetical protein
MHGRLDRKTFMTTLGAAGLGLGMTVATGGVRSTLAHERPPGGEEPLDELLRQREAFYQDFTAALAEALRRPSLNGQESNQSGATPSSQEQGGGTHGQSGRDRGRMPASQSGAAVPSSASEGEPPQRNGSPGQGGARPSETTQGGAPSDADAVDAAIRQAIMAVIDARQTQGGLTYGQAEALKTLVATDTAPIAPGPISLLWLGAHASGAADGQMEQGNRQAGQGKGGEPSRPGGGSSGQRGMGGDEADQAPTGGRGGYP